MRHRLGCASRIRTNNSEYCRKTLNRTVSRHVNNLQQKLSWHSAVSTRKKKTSKRLGSPAGHLEGLCWSQTNNIADRPHDKEYLRTRNRNPKVYPRLFQDADTKRALEASANWRLWVILVPASALRRTPPPSRAMLSRAASRLATAAAARACAARPQAAVAACRYAAARSLGAPAAGNVAPFAAARRQRLAADTRPQGHDAHIKLSKP